MTATFNEVARLLAFSIAISFFSSSCFGQSEKQNVVNESLKYEDLNAAYVETIQAFERRTHPKGVKYLFGMSGKFGVVLGCVVVRGQVA